MTVLEEMRACIVGMHEGGMKSTNIAAIIRVSTKTMQTIIKKFKEGGIYKGNTSIGRPMKLGEKDLRKISLFLRTHCQSSLQDITNDFPMEVDTRTICRLDFARRYCGWSAKH
jgi:transposase